MGKENLGANLNNYPNEVSGGDAYFEPDLEVDNNNEKSPQHHAKQMQRAHDMYGVPLDLDERVATTMEARGLVPIPQTKDWPLPRTPEEGAVSRMDAQEWPGGATPVAVRYGDIVALAKFRHSDPFVENGKEVGGLKQEFEITKAFYEAGARVVRPLAYYPASPEGSKPDDAELLETLVVEAVHPDKASARKQEDWTPEIAVMAAQHIATFRIPASEMPLFEDTERAIVYERDLKHPLLPRLQNQSFREALETIEEAYGSLLDKEVIVHGDCWPNNVLVDKDDRDIQFVDLELAGRGYDGQDTGRMLWGLTINSDWNLSEIGENADAFIDEWCKTEEDRAALCFGVMFEALRWIRDRQKIVDDPETDEATRISNLSEIDDIQEHAVAIVERIAMRAQSQSA